MFLNFYFQKLLSFLFQEKVNSRCKLLAKIYPQISVRKAMMLEPLKPIT